MKRNEISLIVVAAGLSFTALTSETAFAQTTTYNTTQTAINGTGNTSSGWSVYSSPDLTLGMMAEYNYPGYPNNAMAPADPSDGAGTFLFPTGSKPGSPTRGQYDIWFSVGTPGTSLAASGLDFYWSVTTTGPGTPYGPIELSLYSDSSYGNASTPNGGGTVGTYAAMSGANSLFQNAQDPSWLIAGYDPNANQVVSVDIYAVAAGANPLTATPVGEITDNIDVVPEPSTTASALLAFIVGLCGMNRPWRKAC